MFARDNAGGYDFARGRDLLPGAAELNASPYDKRSPPLGELAYLGYSDRSSEGR